MANLQKTAIVTGGSQGVTTWLRTRETLPKQIRSQRQRIWHWSMETSMTRRRPQKSWIRPCSDLAASMWINNAGIFIPKPFTEYTTEDFNALVSTTLAGFLYVTQL